MSTGSETNKQDQRSEFIDDKCVFNYTDTYINLIPVQIFDQIKTVLVNKGTYLSPNLEKISPRPVKNEIHPWIGLAQALSQNFSMDTKWILSMDEASVKNYGLEDVRNLVLSLKETEKESPVPPGASLPKFQVPKERKSVKVEDPSKAAAARDSLMINLLPGTRSILAALRRVNWSHPGGLFLSMDRRVRYVTRFKKLKGKKKPPRGVVIAELVDSDENLSAPE